MRKGILILIFFFYSIVPISSQGSPKVDLEPSRVESVSFQVDPKQESCLVQDIAVSSEVEALVMVYRGGKLDIEMRINSPSGKEIYAKLLFSNLDDKSGRMLPTIVKKGSRFTAEEQGLYTFCFNNVMAKWTAKVMTFDLTVVPKGGRWLADGPLDTVVKTPASGITIPKEGLGLTTADGLDKTAMQHLGTLRSYSNRVFDQLYYLFRDLEYHRQRSNRHHETLLFTEGRITSWSSGELITVLLCALIQVFVVRKWFAEGYVEKDLVIGTVASFITPRDNHGGGLSGRAGGKGSV